MSCFSQSFCITKLVEPCAMQVLSAGCGRRAACQSKKTVLRVFTGWDLHHHGNYFKVCFLGEKHSCCTAIANLENPGRSDLFVRPESLRISKQTPQLWLVVRPQQTQLGILLGRCIMCGAREPFVRKASSFFIGFVLEAR